MLIPFPVAFFVATFVCDVVYLTNGEEGWARAAMYLLGAGLVMGLLAALAGFADFFGDRRVNSLKDAWLHMIGNLVVVLLQAVNFYLRYTAESPGDAIAPSGVIISGAVVALMLFTGWKGWELVYKHRVGVSEREQAGG
jgi:uncharacterized membrane protein